VAHIQSGSKPKTAAGLLRVTFPSPFPHVPVVVVTPYWQGQTPPIEVNYKETVITITQNDFTVFSNNFAANYYVNWIAVVDSF
jgi:hypothetical protein